jgi:hypothetical protein
MRIIQKPSGNVFKTSCLIVLISISLSACNEPASDPNAKKTYYDLKGFIENQVVYLNETKPKVTKTVRLNGKKEVRSDYKTDWKKELELFTQADINKPAYRNSYIVVRSDSAVYEYKVKAGENLPVRYLIIKVDSATQQPLSVKALIQAENKIYNSEKLIELTCRKSNNLLGVSAFSVKGYQKLLFVDKKSFDITSKIGL